MIRLFIVGLLPAVCASAFYYAEKNTGFGKCPNKIRQIIIGIVFGIIAIISTEFSIEIGGAATNVRDAAPLTAGLIFGGPAGIIAGLIGAVERWFAALWGVGEYTRLACTLATGFAGIQAALVRRFLLDDKKPSWFYALVVGVTTEVFHMLLVFVTNMSDLRQAFSFVRKCTFPMILANGFSVMLASLCVSLMGKKKREKDKTGRRIDQAFQRWLMVCVSFGFIFTCFFAFAIQDRVAKSNVEELLRINMQDVQNDIQDVSDSNLLKITHEIARELPENVDKNDLLALAVKYDVSEINVINNEGFITVTTDDNFINFDMRSGEQSAAFLPLLEGETEVVQEYQPIAFDTSISRKYAGVALEHGEVLQVGYDAQRFQKDIDDFAVQVAKNRHIGQNGCVIIVDEDWIIVSDRENHEGTALQNTGLQIDEKTASEKMLYEASVYGVPSYYMYTNSEGYYIISMIPVEEAVFSRQVSVLILIFMEILVFAALFACIYFLIKKLVVDNIHKINKALTKITGGNLEVTVDVRSSQEFASLSDDINTTVNALKRYIAEAEARIDAELEFARTIQLSSLPSVFPPYPNRTDFDIYATMDTAKEVGGDFYDFYFVNENELAFIMADVSGKGIPAAMFMMKAKTIIKNLAEGGMDVTQIFTKANECLCEGNDANMFVTGWLGVLDLRTGHLTYANAGHNPPMLRRKDGEFEYLKAKPNFILAGMNGVRYRKHELWLQPGDMIYLYTDGITEAQNKEQQLYGEERLRRVLNFAAELDVEAFCRKIKADVDAFVGEAEQFDDMTMLVLRIHSLERNSVFTAKPDRDSLIQMSEFIDKRLDELELPIKLCSKLKIVTDEIYSNIVYYSNATKVEIKCNIVNGRLILTFMDDGIPYNPLDTKESDITGTAEERQIGGLGVMIVRNLMDNMEYEYTEGQNRLILMKKI